MNRSSGNGVAAAAGLALVAMVAAGCGDSAPSEQGVTAGAELYRSTCAVCHGPEAKGVAMLGKDLRANEFVKSLSDPELVAFLIEGRPGTHPLNERGVAMPPRGGNPSLTDEELGQIGAYLRSIE